MTQKDTQYHFLYLYKSIGWHLKATLCFQATASSSMFVGLNFCKKRENMVKFVFNQVSYPCDVNFDHFNTIRNQNGNQFEIEIDKR